MKHRLALRKNRITISHRMNFGKLTIFVGLPGAGKTTEIKKIRPSITGLCIEDFHDKAFGDSPAVEHSKHYRALIEALRAGHDCAIADIRFCEPQGRTNLEQAIYQEISTVCMEWKFFENDYAKCEKNIHFRSPQTPEPALAKLKEFAPKYVIPDGATTIPIWPEKYIHDRVN